jgi:hypothetical protein
VVAKGGTLDSRVSALQGQMKSNWSIFVWTLLDGHIILRTSSDLFIFNSGLRWKASFERGTLWRTAFEKHWRLQSVTLLPTFSIWLAFIYRSAGQASTSLRPSTLRPSTLRPIVFRGEGHSTLLPFNAVSTCAAKNSYTRHIERSTEKYRW